MREPILVERKGEEGRGKEGRDEVAEVKCRRGREGMERGEVYIHVCI